MQIRDLKANPRNPRRISPRKLEALRKSVEQFGDLSGFVLNKRTGFLVGGHQRTKVLPKDSKVVIEVKHKEPTSCRTVAEGYIIVGQERFKYREVDADEKWETEALLAANKHGGAWDTDLLRSMLNDQGINLELTGFDIPELKDMGIEIAPPEVRIEAIADEVLEQTDEEYVASTPQTTEEIPTESIPSTVNEGASKSAFDAVEEKTAINGKRFVIIVDCPSQAVKDDLRERLLPAISEAGAKIF